MWLDTLVRYGPFGLLPEQAANGREAYLLPEPGRPLVAVKTPAQASSGGREVTLDLKLSEGGTLSGDVREVYSGFEAAQLAETLEGVSQEQRDQALQQALARYFGGAELSNLKVEVERKVGAPLTLRYHFVAPSFARVEEGRMTLGPLTYPAQVGRRYVTVGTRQSPLFIDSTEQNVSHVRLTPAARAGTSTIRSRTASSPAPSASSPAPSRRVRSSPSRRPTGWTWPGSRSPSTRSSPDSRGEWTCSRRGTSPR